MTAENQSARTSETKDTALQAPHENDAKTVRTSSRKGLANSVLGTRNLMTVAALSVVGLIILIPLNYVSAGLMATPQMILIASSLMGLWVIPYMLPISVVRRPGATMLAALIMGIICIFTTPSGVGAIIGNLIGGLFIEVPFAVMLYRKWTWWAHLISAGVFGTLNGLMYLKVLEKGMNITIGSGIVVASITSALVGALIVLGLTRLLQRAGVGVANQA